MFDNLASILLSDLEKRLQDRLTFLEEIGYQIGESSRERTGRILELRNVLHIVEDFKKERDR